MSEVDEGYVDYLRTRYKFFTGSPSFSEGKQINCYFFAKFFSISEKVDRFFLPNGSFSIIHQ